MSLSILYMLKHSAFKNAYKKSPFAGIVGPIPPIAAPAGQNGYQLQTNAVPDIAKRIGMDNTNLRVTTPAINMFKQPRMIG